MNCMAYFHEWILQLEDADKLHYHHHRHHNELDLDFHKLPCSQQQHHQQQQQLALEWAYTQKTIPSLNLLQCDSETVDPLSTAEDSITILLSKHDNGDRDRSNSYIINVENCCCENIINKDDDHNSKINNKINNKNDDSERYSTGEALSLKYEVHNSPNVLTTTTRGNCNSNSQPTELYNPQQQHGQQQLQQLKAPPRKVHFDTTVEIREYAVTVGDHPCCHEGLPLSLSWEYAPEPLYKPLLHHEKNERVGRYQLPPRLSYEQRRWKLLHVSAYTDSRVRLEEMEMISTLLQQSWLSQANNPKNLLLPPLPTLEDFEQDEEDLELQVLSEQPWRRPVGESSNSRRDCPESTEEVIFWKRRK